MQSELLCSVFFLQSNFVTTSPLHLSTSQTSPIDACSAMVGAFQRVPPSGEVYRKLQDGEKMSKFSLKSLVRVFCIL